MKNLLRYSLVSLAFGISTLSIAQAQIAPDGMQPTTSSSTPNTLDRSKLKSGWKANFYLIEQNNDAINISEVPLKSTIISSNDTQPYSAIKSLKLPKGNYAFQLDGYLNIAEAGDYGFDLLIEPDPKRKHYIKCQYSLNINGDTIFNENKFHNGNATRDNPVFRINKMVKLDAGFVPAKLIVACYLPYGKSLDYSGLNTTLSVKKPFDDEIKLPDANFILHEEK